MLDQPIFRITDPERIRDVLDAHPWATLVTAASRGLQVSHLPVLPADRTGPAMLGHLARADGRLHDLGEHDVVLIVQGPHGYLSPSWYGEVPHVPTWNFVTVHLHGRPELLDADATYRVLSDTVDRLEAPLPAPWTLDRVAEYAERIAGNTVGFRLDPVRVVAKAKLSQDESTDLVARSVTMLRAEHAYRQPALADEMHRSWLERTAPTAAPLH